MVERRNSAAGAATPNSAQSLDLNGNRVGQWSMD